MSIETRTRVNTPLPETRLPFLTQFTLVFLAAVVLPLGTIGGFAWIQTRENNIQRVEDNVAIVGSAKVDELRARIFETNQAVENVIFENDNLQDYYNTLSGEDEEAAQQTFERILSNYPSIIAIKLFNNVKTPIVETGIIVDTPRVTFQDLDFGTILLPKISLIYSGPGNRPLADMVFIIQSSRGSRLGSIVVIHDLNIPSNNIPSLYEVLQTPSDLETLPTGAIHLFSETPLSADTNRVELVGTSQRSATLFNNDYATTPPVTKTDDDEFKSRFNLAEQNFGAQTAIYTSNISGEPVIAYFERIGGTRWILAIEFDEDEASGQESTLSLVIGLISALLLLNLAVYWLAYQRLVPPIIRVVERMNTFSFIRPVELPNTAREDEVGQLYKAYNRLLNYTLNQFNQQNASAEHANQKLNLVYDLNKILGVLDIDFVLGEMVRQLQEQMSTVDYAQIFMIDENNQKATLRAGTGDVGRRLVVQGYQQNLNTGGLVSNAIVLAQPQLINDVSKSMEYGGNIRFPNAKSIAVLPVKLRDHVLAVLEIHSFKAGAFTDDDIELFGALASELALVIVAAQGQPLTNLTQVIQKRDEELGTAFGFAGMASYDKEWSDLQQRAAFNRMIAVEEKKEIVNFALPVILRDEVLGAVEWTVKKDQYNNQLVQTANELVGRLALAIDNARLFDRSQRLIERERKVNDISQKISSQNDIHQILQMAVRELGQALGTGDTVIRLNLDNLTED